MSEPTIEIFETAVDGGVITGLRVRAADGQGARKPLILAVHGGTYTGKYFDVPGHSLMERAAARGFDVIAIDRPGYGGSTALPDAPDLIQKNAEYLLPRVPALLSDFGRDGAPVFVIGHSIGGAITVSMAALQPDWNLSGIAVSGVGLKTPPESAAAYAQFPKTYFVELPTPMKDQVMFGPAETQGDGMPDASHVANTHCPLNELLDITGGWQGRVAHVASKVRVPVHTRQGEHEALWLTSPALVDDFAALFTGSGQVDAGLVKDAGHCIDYHRVGAAFQDSQLDFAEAVASARVT